MALPFTEDTIKWSDDTFSIRDVADSNLPTVVKVADGFYSENEAESFSNGDLIKLDFKKNYSKVRAQCVGRTPREDSSGYMSPDKDILIPLGYKGKLKVECMRKTFNTIEELIAHFPHYVTTGRPLTGKRGVYSSEQFRIEKGVRLELDRVIPKAGLVCKIDGKEVLLPLGQLARFDVEADDKEYTIREVIDSFKLPQYVRFLDSDFEKIVTSDLTEAIDNISHFEGYLRLVGLVQQEVVVGHHKPSGIAAITSEKANQRAIAILPLDSEAVQNIEVYLPVYEEESDYEFFLARNFSKNMNLDVVDGGLYLEFSKCPRIHLLNTEDDDDTPPPRPPPPPGCKFVSYLSYILRTCRSTSYNFFNLYPTKATTIIPGFPYFSFVMLLRIGLCRFKIRSRYHGYRSSLMGFFYQQVMENIHVIVNDLFFSD